MNTEFSEWCEITVKSESYLRSKLRHLLIDGIKSESPECHVFVNWLDSSKCAFIGFSIGCIFVPHSKIHHKKVYNFRFNEPTLMYKHKRLPMLISSSPDLLYSFNSSHQIKIPSNNNIKERLSWLPIFMNSKIEEKEQMKKILLEGISKYSDEGRKYANWLNSSECDLIGYGVNSRYIKEKGSKEEVEALWVHPFGGPTLVYKHKSLPMLITTSPTLEFNDSHIKKAKLNGYYESIIGITD